MPGPINVGIVGYGLSAKVFHIPFLTSLPELYTLHTIVQRTPGPSGNAPADHPTVKHTTSFDALLADAAVQLVILCTTPTTHYAMAHAALHANKHVLVEKPFVPHSSEASALATLAASRNLHLCVYQNRRFDADFLQLRAHLPSLGRIVDFESHFDRHRPDPPASAAAAGWKSRPDPGNGAIYDLGTHLLDQIYVLFGLPQKVTARLFNQREYTVEGTGGEAGGDSFTVVLQYARGLTATARASVVSPEARQLRFWVRGTEGGFKKTGLDPQEDQLKAGMGLADERFASEDGALRAVLTTVKGHEMSEEVLDQAWPRRTYRTFFELLADALLGKGEVPVPAREAADVLRIVEAAVRSSEEERTVAL